MTAITREELEATDGSEIIGHIADDANAQARTAQGKLRDFINIMDFHDPAEGDDLTEALETLIYEAFPDLEALMIYIPEGQFKVSRQIIPARQINLRGAGMFATRLEFENVASVNATMKGAFSFGLKNTVEAYDPAHESKEKAYDETIGRNGADYSTVEDLCIQLSGSRPSGFNYGLWSAARLFVRNVYLRGAGAKLVAGTLLSSSGSVTGIANSSELNNVHSIYAPEHAFWAEGTDVNACRFIGCNAYVPATYGFYECGLIGNSYIGCHASGGNIATRGYIVGNSAETSRSSFIGCYAEDDFKVVSSVRNNPWDVLLPATIIAPQGALPIPDWNKNSTLTGSAGGGFTINDKLAFVANMNGWEMGDSTHPATRVFPGGILIRGQGDGHEYWMIGKDTGYITGGGDGISIIKRLGGTDTKYELVHYGDTRHRPAFPRGLIATLPTYANNSAAGTGGLTAGEVYKTATGELRIKV